MDKNNNKGFTMVELLVAMAIMGLLVIMAFPTIRSVQTNNTNTKYEEYGKAAISAAKLYTDSYSSDLFDSNTNQSISIDFNELVKKDLLKDINVSNSTCLNGSSINIIKYDDDYTYCLNLLCKANGSNKELYKKVSKEGKCKDLTVYQVTYNIKNHDSRSISVIEGNNHTVLAPEELGFSSSDQANFKQWKSEQVGPQKPGKVIEVNNNIIFDAEISAFDYIVRYKSSLDGVKGKMKDQPCTVGKSCVLKDNGFSKDYYTFTNYLYKSNSYKPGRDLKNIVHITKNNQVIVINTEFAKNALRLNYYSNRGVLKPGRNQVCPVFAGCKKNECQWPQSVTCKAKTGLVLSSRETFDFDRFDSLRAYNVTEGSLYMTRSGCTGSRNWVVDDPKGKLKVDEGKEFKNPKDFANYIKKGDKLKKGSITVDVFAEWDCPNSITCAAGKYLPKKKSSCAVCTAGNYCIGGTFKKNANKDQGLTKCPKGYGNSAKGSKKISDCYIKVNCGKYIKAKKATSPSSCSSGSVSTAHSVYYGNTSKCTKCSTGYESSSTNSCSCSKEIYTITIKKGSNVNWVSLDGNKNTLTKKVAYGDQVTISSDASDYYQVDQWVDSKGVTRFNAPSKTFTVTGNMTLTAKARTNKITVIYYYMGGELHKAKRQKCLPLNDPILEGCKIDECKKPNTCYKTPGHDDYGYDKYWATEGLRNYSRYKDATLYLKKTGFNATGYWHLHKNYHKKGLDKPKFKEDTPFPKKNTGLEFAKQCGSSYANNLKTKDITIKLYAGWEK